MMQPDQNKEALLWISATSRWLRRELQACDEDGTGSRVLLCADLRALLCGLVCVQEPLADAIREKLNQIK
jgi:hypothetical protein